MNLFKTAIKIFVVMTLLTGFIYPLFITLIAQFTMPYHANGSLIEKGDRIIGSLLIAQKTTDNRYFWPRPSAIDYDPIKPSGGSNLGPTSQKLKDIVNKRKDKMGKDAPGELLYASGSGLDPHISLETAYFQIARVAKARSMDEEALKRMINSTAERNFKFKARYVNVLLLNEALDGK
ncbi:MAG: potassium-transporting ATPase subunit KdpC [Parachlamydiaceae bacterium]|nr:potassium-transporting ATPase subunit KdpC [Parachlamydiaceae bacterium]